jgi:hypothetical protein
MQRQAIWKVLAVRVCNRHACFPPNLPAAAEPTPFAASGAYATKSDYDHGLQYSDLDLNLNLNISMGLMDSDSDADGVGDDGVVVPSPTPPTPHALLRTSGTHGHPGGTMLGFPIAIPWHDDADVDARTILGHTYVSPERGLDSDITSLSVSVSGGSGRVD